MSEQVTEGPNGVLVPLTVSVKEAARLLGVNASRVYRALDRGELEEAPFGGRRLVTYRSLQRVLPELPEAS